jgi:hypothetical protein
VVVGADVVWGAVGVGVMGIEALGLVLVLGNGEAMAWRLWEEDLCWREEWTMGEWWFVGEVLLYCGVLVCVVVIVERLKSRRGASLMSRSKLGGICCWFFQLAFFITLHCDTRCSWYA